MLGWGLTLMRTDVKVRYSHYCVLVCASVLMLTAIFVVFFCRWMINTDATLYLLIAPFILVQNVSLVPPWKGAYVFWKSNTNLFPVRDTSRRYHQCCHVTINTITFLSISFCGCALSIVQESHQVKTLNHPCCRRPAKHLKMSCIYDSGLILVLALPPPACNCFTLQALKWIV